MELEKNQEKLDELVVGIKDKYRVRSFSTTTEGVTFLKTVMPTFSSIGEEMENLKDQDVSKIFDIFPDETIKYLISTFVEVKTPKGFKKVDYETEFKGDFETLIGVFIMGLMDLIKEVQTPKGKQQAKTQKKKINTRKR